MSLTRALLAIQVAPVAYDRRFGHLSVFCSLTLFCNGINATGSMHASFSENTILRYLVFAMRIVFSAVEALKSRSSIVAMNVANFSSVLISVITLLPLLNVFMNNPVGVLKLSGETALAMASAVFALPYLRVIVASNFFAFQLFSH
jgi:hypothetical protein